MNYIKIKEDVFINLEQVIKIEKMTHKPEIEGENSYSVVFRTVDGYGDECVYIGYDKNEVSAYINKIESVIKSNNVLLETTKTEDKNHISGHNWNQI